MNICLATQTMFSVGYVIQFATLIILAAFKYMMKFVFKYDNNNYFDKSINIGMFLFCLVLNLKTQLSLSNQAKNYMIVIVYHRAIT